MGKYDKEIPACSICLVVCAVVAHTMVLSGNLLTAASVSSIGDSAKHWSWVGTGVADSLKDEVGAKMTEVNDNLKNAVTALQGIDTVMNGMTMALGGILDKAAAEIQVNANNVALLQETGTGDQQAHYALDKSLEVNDVVVQLMAQTIMKKMDKQFKALMDGLKPALEGGKDWMDQFSESIQNGMETFGNTLDKQQKLFDQAISGLSKFGISLPIPGQALTDIEYETFSLFDVSDSGAFTSLDLNTVAQAYGIDALKGDKAEALIEKYDTDLTLSLNKREFHNFVQDPSIPGIMPNVLRQYSKKLAQLAGNMGQSTVRAQVSEAFVDWLVLVSSKNMTKVEWVSQAITNGSLPLVFTVDVMKKLGAAVDNPDLNVSKDLGKIVISGMARMNLTSTYEMIIGMGNVSDWEATGQDFTMNEHYCERIMGYLTDFLTAWQGEQATDADLRKKALKDMDAALDKIHSIADGKSGNSSSKKSSLLQREDERTLTDEEETRVIQGLASKLRSHRQKQMGEIRQQKYDQYRSYFQSDHQRAIYFELLQATPSDNPAAAAAVAQGAKALPQTLNWIKMLVSNVTQTYKRFDDMCATNSKTSSDATASAATQMSGMIKKMKSFLTQIGPLSNPQAIKNMEDKIKDFLQNGQEQLYKFAEGLLSKYAHGKSPSALISDKKGLLLLQKAKLTGEKMRVSRDVITKFLNGEIEEIPRYPYVNEAGETNVNDATRLNQAILAEIQAQEEQIPNIATIPTTPTSPVWKDVKQVVHQLATVAPGLIDILRFSQKEVGSLSSLVDSLFSALGSMAPDNFYAIAGLLRVIWWAYYIFMVVPTLAILAYAFWASGYLGGPGPGVEEPKGPKNIKEKLKTLKRSCGACCQRCQDTALAFWSMILLMELFVFIMYLVCIILSIIVAIEAFVVSSCNGVYILKDNTVCGGALSMLNQFLKTFSVGPVVNGDWNTVCTDLSLALCGAVSDLQSRAMMKLLVGGALAVFFSFHILIDSAQLHEKARMRRKYMIRESELASEGQPARSRAD